MYCSSCGSLINEGQSFCANCGAPVAPAVVQETPVVQAQPVAGAQPAAQPAAQAAQPVAPFPPADSAPSAQATFETAADDSSDLPF